MEAIVFIILQIFFTTTVVLKIGEYHSDIPQFQLGNIQSRDAFRPTACEQKYLMDNNYNYLGKTGFFLAERKFLMSCPPT